MTPAAGPPWRTTRRGACRPTARGPLRRPDGVWEVSVADNGIGTEPENLDRVFVIFRRLHTKD
jgi:signal transduction histidine kinase